MMREDQIQRLKDLSEKLAEVVLQEADPDLWPGAGVPIADMTNEQRGNRYWSKKNAAATFSLLERTHSLLTDAVDPRNQRPSDEVDVEKQIAKREREAEQLLAGVMKKAKQVAGGKA